MLPASGGNLSGGCNSAGSSSYDLTSSGILLELNFFKVHFIGWSPSRGPLCDCGNRWIVCSSRSNTEGAHSHCPLSTQHSVHTCPPQLLDTGLCRSVAVITTSNNTADDSARLPALYTTTTAARGINVTPDQITNTQFDSIDGGPT